MLHNANLFSRFILPDLGLPQEYRVRIFVLQRKCSWLFHFFFLFLREIKFSSKFMRYLSRPSSVPTTFPRSLKRVSFPRAHDIPFSRQIGITRREISIFLTLAIIYTVCTNIAGNKEIQFLSLADGHSLPNNHVRSPQKHTFQLFPTTTRVTYAQCYLYAWTFPAKEVSRGKTNTLAFINQQILRN